jgi:hypothetical protein
LPEIDWRWARPNARICGFSAGLSWERTAQFHRSNQLHHLAPIHFAGSARRAQSIAIAFLYLSRASKGAATDEAN